MRRHRAGGVLATGAGWRARLTGKYKPGEPPPAGSRAADPKQNIFLMSGIVDNYIHDRIRVDAALLKRVQQLSPFAREAGLSLSQLALAWCLRQNNVASVIVGASRPEQVTDNAGATGKTLTTDILAAIDQVLRG